MMGLKPIYMLVIGSWIQFKLATINPLSPEVPKLLIKQRSLRGDNT